MQICLMFILILFCYCVTKCYAWRYVFAPQYCDVTIESFPSRLTLIDLANQNTYYKTIALEFELRSDFKNVTIIYP